MLDEKEQRELKAALWQGEGVPSAEEVESPDDNRIFEANKRLKRMYESARERVEELEALVSPKFVYKIVADCSEAELARREGAGWEIAHQQFVPKGGMTHVLAVVFKKAVDPIPPTPPGQVWMSGLVVHPEKRESTEDDEAEEGEYTPPAATIERVVALPTLHIMDTEELNRIAVMNTVRRTQEQFRDYAKSSPRPANVVEGSLA